MNTYLYDIPTELIASAALAVRRFMKEPCSTEFFPIGSAQQINGVTFLVRATRIGNVTVRLIK